jgi:hypothetical protein
VERHEAEVFLVQNILTEVGRDVDPALQVQALNLLIESGYRLVGKGGFRGPHQPSLWPHTTIVSRRTLWTISTGRKQYNLASIYGGNWLLGAEAEAGTLASFSKK